MQYASAAGTSWQVTALSGSIPAGGYYLVQEAQGAGGTTALPTPDATGTIAMGATAGKICGAGVLHDGAVRRVSHRRRRGELRHDGERLRGEDDGHAEQHHRRDPRLAGCDLHEGSVGRLLDRCAHAAEQRVAASCLPRRAPRRSARSRRDHRRPRPSFTGGTTQLTATPQDANGQTVTTRDDDLVVERSIDRHRGRDRSRDRRDGERDAGHHHRDVHRRRHHDVRIDRRHRRRRRRINWLDVGWNTTSLPPGFQANMFLTARTGSGGTIIPATFTVEALDPSIADVLPVPNAVDHPGDRGVGVEAALQDHRDAHRRRHAVRLHDGRVDVDHDRDADDRAARRSTRRTTSSAIRPPRPPRTPNDFLITRAAVRDLVQPVARHAELGRVRARQPAVRRRGPLQLLHRRPEPSVGQADLHVGLHQRRLRSRPHGALGRPHRGERGQRDDVLSHATSSRSRPT